MVGNCVNGPKIDSKLNNDPEKKSDYLRSFSCANSLNVFSMPLKCLQKDAVAEDLRQAACRCNRLSHACANTPFSFTTKKEKMMDQNYDQNCH